MKIDVSYKGPSRNVRKLGLAASLCTLAACAPHSPYQKPMVALPSEFSANHAVAPEGRILPWWHTFDDPQMVNLVDKALSDNLDIEIALARLEQAAGAARLSGAQRLPEVGIDSSAGITRQSLADPIIGNLANLPGFNRTQEIYGLNLAASWELDLFGRLAAGERAAIADAAAAEAQVVGVRLAVAAETAVAYITLAELHAQLNNTGKRVDTLADLQRIVALRYKNGIAARLEVDQIDAELASARATLPTLRSNIASVSMRLLILTGGTPNLDKIVLEPEKVPDAPIINVAATPADLLLRRPDLVAAERRVASADARVAQAIAAYYPRFSLSGLLGLLSGDLSDLLTGDAFRAEGVAGMSIPLFDFGRRDAQRAVAEAGTREAIGSYRLAIRQALGEVETSLISTAQERERANELSVAASALARARRTSRLAYEAGAVSLIEALDAERRSLEAESELITARAETARSAVAAYRALGVEGVDRQLAN